MGYCSDNDDEKKRGFFWLRRLPILPFCNNWSTLSMTMTMTMTMTMSFSFIFICAECAPLPLCFLFLDSLYLPLFLIICFFLIILICLYDFGNLLKLKMNIKKKMSSLQYFHIKFTTEITFLFISNSP